MRTGLHAVSIGTNGSRPIDGVFDGLGLPRSPPEPLMTYSRRMLNILGLSMGWCLMVSVMFIQLSTTTLAARDYGGSATSTLPAGIMMAAATVSMTPGSLLMQQFGRKPVLLLSAAAGIGGGVLLVLAAQFKLLWLLIVGSIPLGVCFAQANNLRFAATEFAPAGQQHKALSLVVTGAVLACVVGPEVGRHTLRVMQPPYTATYCFVTGLCLLYAILVAVVEFHMLGVLAAAGEETRADAAATVAAATSSSSSDDCCHGMASAPAGMGHGSEVPPNPQALAVATAEAGPETGPLEGARAATPAEARAGAGAVVTVMHPPPSLDGRAHNHRRQSPPATTWLQDQNVTCPESAVGVVAKPAAAAAAAEEEAMGPAHAGVEAAGPSYITCISYEVEGGIAGEFTRTRRPWGQQNSLCVSGSCPGSVSGPGSGPVAEAAVVVAVGPPPDRRLDSEAAVAGSLGNSSSSSNGGSRSSERGSRSSERGSRSSERGSRRNGGGNRSNSGGNSDGGDSAKSSSSEPGGMTCKSLHRRFLSWDYLVPVLTASLSYFTMAGMMTASPLAMRDSGYSFGETTQVIQVHIICMFLPSLFTGDVIGLITAHTTMTCGSVLLAAGAAIFFVGQHLPIFFAGNSVVGLGWNWAYVGASALVTNTYDPTTKFVAQGVMDTLVLFGTGLSGILAGPLYSRLGWGAYTAFFVGWSGGMILVDMVFLMVLLLRRRKAEAVGKGA